MNILNDLIKLVNSYPKGTLELQHFYEQVQSIVLFHNRMTFRLDHNGYVIEQKMLSDDMIRFKEQSGKQILIIQSRMNFEK